MTFSILMMFRQGEITTTKKQNGISRKNDTFTRDITSLEGSYKRINSLPEEAIYSSV